MCKLKQRGDETGEQTRDCASAFYDTEFWRQMREEEYWSRNKEEHGDFYKYWDAWHTR